MVKKLWLLERWRPLGTAFFALLCGWLCICHHAGAQAPYIRFDRLGVDEGLSQSTAQAIFQDHDGYMWIGTQDGLNRWDGLRFELYRLDPSRPNGPSDSKIRAITQSLDGAIWIGNDIGSLDRFDPRSGIFTHYAANADRPGALTCGPIRALRWESATELWVGGRKGLNKLNISTGEASTYDDPGGVLVIRDLLLDSHGTLWIAHARGLGRIRPGMERLESVSIPGMETRELFSLASRADGTLWVGLAGHIVLLKVHAEATSTVVKSLDLPDNGAKKQLAQKMLVDNEGVLWVGGADGLYRMDDLDGKLAEYRPDPTDPHSLADEEILDIYQDRSGLLWFGTMTGGVNRWHPLAERFSPYPQGNTLEKPTTYSFGETRDGTVWMGTAGGLLRWVPGRDFEVARGRTADGESSSAGLISDFATSLQGDRDGALWIGTRRSGVFRFHPVTEELEHFTADPRNPDTLSVDLIMDLYEAPDGAIYIGTAGGGLNRFEAETRTFRRFHTGDGKSQEFVSNIAQADDGSLWLATYRNGFYRFDPETERAVHFGADGSQKGLPTDSIFLVHPQGNSLWLGSLGAGLIAMDLQDATPGRAVFRTWNESDGLANSTINGIQADASGNLWLSTNRGLSRFDPRTETFTNYSPRHGLQGWEFTLGASMKASTGELFFGGANGFNKFAPDLAHRELPAPNVVISGLRINNTPRPLPDDGMLHLGHRDSTLSIDLAALDFWAPQQNRYAYRLEGFDGDWTSIGPDRPVVYTNLDPGSYVFRLRAANSERIWSAEKVHLRIHVERAPWDSWWAWSLYVLFGSALIYGGVRWRLGALQRRSIELKKQVDQRTVELQETVSRLKESETVALEAKRRAIKSLEEALEERRKAQEADQAKSVFLSSMSHELRTPLNAVLGFAQLMERDPRIIPEHQDSLKVILRSGEHLLSLINDVLSLAKIEAGRLSLRSEPFLLLDLCHDVEEMVRPQAEEKGLELRVDGGDGLPPAVLGDAGRLMQVLLNLMGNAVKFTHRGSVTLAVRSKSTLIELAIRDTGVGIHEDELHKLFEPFQQTASGRESREGTGLGLAISERLVDLMGGVLRVDSKPAQGTTFTFALPLVPCDPSLVVFNRRKVVGLRLEDKPPKILIADDTEENRRLLERLFTEVGFPVRTAADGREAVDVWREWRPSLIWMDMRMPVMDGYEATRTIRQEEEKLVTGRTVVVALTAAAFEDDRREILDTGCDAVVTKPYQEHELFETMAAHLGLTYVFQEGDDLPSEELDQSDDDITQEILSPLLSGASSKDGEPRVLIAEDNPSNQMVARRMLERLGYQAEVVGNGALALDALAKTPYPLVLMDIRMPRMDGFEACRRIRSGLNAETQPIIIALTGLASEAERRMCLQAGMNDLLAKPFRIEELRDMLAKWAPASLAEAQKKSPPTAERRSAPAGPAGPAETAAGRGTLNRKKLDLLDELDDGTGTAPLSVQVISLFLDTVPGQIRELQRAVADQDRRRWRSVTHSLKNSSSTLGAESLSELCRRLESLSSKPDPDGSLYADALALMTELEQESRAALEALNREKAAADRAFQDRKTPPF